MEASVEDFRARLKEKGYKLTFQRMTIFEALREGPRHPTAEELHRYVARKFPMIGLSTVYNTLETLCQLGELSKVAIGPNVTRYDVSPEPHVHLVCLKCGQILDMPDLKCEPCQQAVERKVGFRVVRHDATFYGYCAECRTKAEVGEEENERTGTYPAS